MHLDLITKLLCTYADSTVWLLPRWVPAGLDLVDCTGDGWQFFFWISVLTPLSSQFNNCQHKVPGEYQTSSCWCLLHSNLAVTYITNSHLGTFLALCEVDMLVSPCECRPAHLFSDRVDKQNDWLQNWKNVWSKQAGHRPSTIPGRSIGAVVVNVVIKDGDDQMGVGRVVLALT